MGVDIVTPKGQSILNTGLDSCKKKIVAHLSDVFGVGLPTTSSGATISTSHFTGDLEEGIVTWQGCRE